MTTDYITAEDLMDLASIDGTYNNDRVAAWRDAGIATIENATGYKVAEDTKNSEADKEKFIKVANIYLQEYARSNYLAPNYPTTMLPGLLTRLKLMAEELLAKEQVNG